MVSPDRGSSKQRLARSTSQRLDCESSPDGGFIDLLGRESPRLGDGFDVLFAQVGYQDAVAFLKEAFQRLTLQCG